MTSSFQYQDKDVGVTSESSLTISLIFNLSANPSDLTLQYLED